MRINNNIKSIPVIITERYLYREDNRMNIKDCSSERDPFVKYEYSKSGDELENLGIRIVKSIADDVRYSFIYGVNFISITV